MKKRLLLVLAVVIAFVAAGCTTLGTLQIRKSQSVSLSKYATVALEVTGSDLVRKETIPAEIAKLKEKVLNKMYEGKCFETIYDYDTDRKKSNLYMSVRIVGFNPVNEAARLLAGSLAGPTKVTLQVVFTDAATGNVIGDFLTEGQTYTTTRMAGIALIPEWDVAMDPCVNRIVNYIHLSRVEGSAAK